VTLVLVALGCFGCDNEVTVNFRSGPLDFILPASAGDFPVALREDAPSGARLATVPCAADLPCPSFDGLDLSCAAGSCDPSPVEMAVAIGDVTDFDNFGEDGTADGGDGRFLNDIFTRVDRLEVREALYQVSHNTLTVDIPSIDLLWAPEGAVSGMTLLGTAPPQRAGTTGTGDVVMDSGGQTALSNYLVNTSRRVRFFATTEIDLEPGGHFPEGELRGSLQLALTAAGPLIN